MNRAKVGVWVGRPAHGGRLGGCEPWRSVHGGKPHHKDDTFTCELLPAPSDTLLVDNVTCGAAQPQCTLCTHTFPV